MIIITLEVIRLHFLLCEIPIIIYLREDVLIRLLFFISGYGNDFTFLGVVATMYECVCNKFAQKL